MGGRMPFYRMVGRNSLYGDYGDSDEQVFGVVNGSNARGDITRMLRDELAETTVAEYARMAKTSRVAVRKILRAVFDVPEPGCDDCQRQHAEFVLRALDARERKTMVSANYRQRCDEHASRSPGLVGDTNLSSGGGFYADIAKPGIDWHAKWAKRWR